MSVYQNAMVAAAQGMATLNSEIETVFFVSKPELSFLSSSVAKEIAYFNGKIDTYIPKQIIKEVSKKLYK